jgi:hypothetical protein
MTIFVPSSGPGSWRKFLAKPELHWSVSKSARTLAHAWEASSGFPAEVADILAQALGPIKLLFGIPEFKTPLPGGSTESQSDVFAVGRHARGLIACTIEGKVEEAFGPTLAQRMKDASPGSIERISYLCALLGIERCPDDVHYQLLHRTASALIEADRLHASDAAMIVHSFSPERKWFNAFQRFAEVLGQTVEPGKAAKLIVPGGQRLVIGWATGDQRFCAM